MPRSTRLLLVAYLLFNLAIAATVVVAPADLDAQYRGEPPITPTREFLWFSIGSFHLFVAATVAITLRLRDVEERRWLIVANAGFYLWDALTQWAYWGARVGVEPGDLLVNAGVSAGTAAALVVAAALDRPASPRH